MVETLETFFELWLIRLEGHLQNLLHAIEHKENEQRCKELIHQMIAHYGEYFVAKEKVADEDVFRVISPTWFSSLERAYLWIGGFRPGLVFHLISSNVIDLTDDQTESIDKLIEEIKAEEKQVTDEFDRVQDCMISSFIQMAMHLERLQNGAKNRMDLVIDELEIRMKAVVECADFLRKKAVGILVSEILKPAQAVRFLAAAATLQLRLRRCGMQRNLQN